MMELNNLFNLPLGDCHLPTLHGVSALGTALRFYQIQTPGMKETPPQNITHSTTKMAIDAAIGQWDRDLLEPEGGTRLKAVVAEIRAGCDERLD